MPLASFSLHLDAQPIIFVDYLHSRREDEADPTCTTYARAGEPPTAHGDVTQPKPGTRCSASGEHAMWQWVAPTSLDTSYRHQNLRGQRQTGVVHGVRRSS
uniref:Uncharacterized protein n=1 Tax=Rhizochromulina marina TaxID=1034831 RepID=A0A7S2R8Y1_9STRA